MQETQVRSLDQKDPLEKGMATLSGILAWRIPWTEEPGRLHSPWWGVGEGVLQRVRHDWATNILHIIDTLFMYCPWTSGLASGLPHGIYNLWLCQSLFLRGPLHVVRQIKKIVHRKVLLAACSSYPGSDACYFWAHTFGKSSCILGFWEIRNLSQLTSEQWLVINRCQCSGCASWAIKKAECQRIDAFELWCWRTLLRVPWTTRRSN